MSSKGGISFPMVLVVTLIIVAIVIALSYIFIFQTSERLQGAFTEIIDSATKFGCNVLGPVQSFVCAEG